MSDIYDAVEQQTGFKTKNNLKYETNNQNLYLKLSIDKKNYIIKFSDIIEIKNTNLVTPLQTAKLQSHKIYGTFYYKQEIIPVYRLGIRQRENNFSIEVRISNDKHDLKKYYNLLILRHGDYYGLIIDQHTSSEIININITKSDINDSEFEIIDVQKIIEILEK